MIKKCQQAKATVGHLLEKSVSHSDTLGSGGDSECQVTGESTHLLTADWRSLTVSYLCGDASSQAEQLN